MKTSHVVVLAGALLTATIAGDTSVRLAAQPPAKKPAAVSRKMVPQFQYDKTFPKPLPNQWKLGHVAGVTVDSRDHVWIVQRPTSLKNSEMEATELSTYGAVGANTGAAASANGGVANVGGAGRGPLALCCRPAPPVIEFDQQGNVVQAWGGPSRANEYEWPTPAPKSPDASLGTGNFGERGIHVDSQDNVWIGSDGPGDAQALKFTRFGRLLFQIGKRGKSGGSNDVGNLNGASGFVVDAKNNEVFVADGLRNRRVVVFDAYDGKYKRHWGAYGKKPDDSVAMKQYEPDVKHPQFGDVSGITLSRDGLVYVCDRVNNRVQVFKTDGTFVKEGAVAPKTLGGSAYDIALSTDPEQRFAYVVDGMNQKVWILDRQSLDTVGSFGHGGHAGGAFNAAKVIATDSNGNIYVGETWESKRVQRFLYKGLGPSTE